MNNNGKCKERPSPDGSKAWQLPVCTTWRSFSRSFTADKLLLLRFIAAVNVGKLIGQSWTTVIWTLCKYKTRTRSASQRDEWGHRLWPQRRALNKTQSFTEISPLQQVLVYLSPRLWNFFYVSATRALQDNWTVLDCVQRLLPYWVWIGL